MTDSTGHVFSRVWGRRLPTAIRADGVWIEGSDGRRYLDAAGGAIVNGVGHGNRTVIDAIAAQLARVDYVHAHSFTTEALENYAGAVSAVAPLSDPKVFPVSGGSEAAETAIKLARTYHLARGEPERTMVLARRGSYHGNTLGALDASGRVSLRAGYEPWLGRFDHLPAANEYRCPNPSHPSACGAWHAGRLEAAIERIGSHRVAAFIAEPIVGATLGAVEPPEDYWPAVAEVCRRHGVLVIADEVMTGFGRTGRWFAIEHWDTRPDILIAGKGAGSGYWPLGLCIASSEVWATAAPGFHHGFTYSHHPVGAAAGSAVPAGRPPEARGHSGPGTAGGSRVGGGQGAALALPTLGGGHRARRGGGHGAWLDPVPGHRLRRRDRWRRRAARSAARDRVRRGDGAGRATRRLDHGRARMTQGEARMQAAAR
jgi:adenosylmethionine-8-amino-7-oxononanoate aminotransferase